MSVVKQASLDIKQLHVKVVLYYLSLNGQWFTGQERMDEGESLAGFVKRYQVTSPSHRHQCHPFIFHYPPSNLYNFIFSSHVYNYWYIYIYIYMYIYIDTLVKIMKNLMVVEPRTPGWFKRKPKSFTVSRTNDWYSSIHVPTVKTNQTKSI